MRHEYYYYSREQLLAAPKLPITVMADNAAVFQTMAREMADEIKRKNALGEKTVFICPVGPVGQYPYFVEMVNSEDISLKNVWFLNMDEYLTDEKEWIGKDHPLSFRGFMDRTVYTKIRPDLVMPESQRVFPDPKDPENMWRTIQALGGVDICFGGIGINGHVAFNEAQDELTPDQFRALPTRGLGDPDRQRHRRPQRGRGRHAPLVRHHWHEGNLQRPEDPSGLLPGLAPGRGPARRLRQRVRPFPGDPAPEASGRPAAYYGICRQPARMRGKP